MAATVSSGLTSSSLIAFLEQHRAANLCSMGPFSAFPPVRACLFDLDGLLINTEDIYATCIEALLKRHGRPQLPPSIYAKMQGRPGRVANSILFAWAELSILDDNFAELSDLQYKLLPSAEPLPGVLSLLQHLQDCNIHLALATSSQETTFNLKTDHLPLLTSFFPQQKRVLGNDSRLGPNRGKPLPDIFLLALQSINSALLPGETSELIQPDECLVFEDSMAGVEAARRAGMRVIWCPHPRLKAALDEQEGTDFAGWAVVEDARHVPKVDRDEGSWVTYLATLEGFPHEKYGFVKSA